MSKPINKNFLIVSDYFWMPENIEESWVHQWADNYLILDKAHRLPESDKVKHQKNVGQNIYDMFDFIITNYENLPEGMIFCRYCIFEDRKGRTNGDITPELFLKFTNNEYLTELHNFGKETDGKFDYDIVDNYLQIYNSPSSVVVQKDKTNESGAFYEINNSWYFNHHPGRYYNNLNTFFNDMYVNPPYLQYIRFSPGANYVIPKHRVLRYSKKFYERIREILSWDVVVGEAHMLERSIYTIFTCDWEVKDEFK